MAITPQTNIRLLKIPLEIDNKNQLTFQNVNAQTSYFLSLPYLLIDNCSYQRHDSYINFPAHIDDILEYNYVMYQNENYDDKYFYAFITQMEYVNDHLTRVFIETDVFQTWQFDIIYHKMFVEREHVNDDTVGSHTVPENLELGPYICEHQQTFNNLSDYVYVIRVSEYINGTKPLATNFGGVISAGGAYVCSTMEQVVNIIQAYPSTEQLDSILSVYMLPSSFITHSDTELQYGGDSSPIYIEQNLNKPNSLNGYVPTNNKLLTFPYHYLSVSNNNGSSNNYLYELFNSSSCTFQIKGVPVTGGSIKLLPYNYKTDDEGLNEEEGLIAGKYPTLSWSGDEYINWLTQNSVNLSLGITSNILTAIGSIASGNPLIATAGITSSAMGIANQLRSSL